MTDTKVEILGSLRTLKLEEGDLVVITVDGDVPKRVFDEISEAWKRLRVPNKCVVLERGMQIEVRKPIDSTVPRGWDEV